MQINNRNVAMSSIVKMKKAICGTNGKQQVLCLPRKNAVNDTRRQLKEKCEERQILFTKSRNGLGKSVEQLFGSCISYFAINLQVYFISYILMRLSLARFDENGMKERTYSLWPRFVKLFEECIVCRSRKTKVCSTMANPGLCSHFVPNILSDKPVSCCEQNRMLLNLYNFLHKFEEGFDNSTQSRDSLVRNENLQCLTAMYSIICTEVCGSKDFKCTFCPEDQLLAQTNIQQFKGMFIPDDYHVSPQKYFCVKQQFGFKNDGFQKGIIVKITANDDVHRVTNSFKTKCFDVELFIELVILQHNMHSRYGTAPVWSSESMFGQTCMYLFLYYKVIYDLVSLPDILFFVQLFAYTGNKTEALCPSNSRDFTLGQSWLHNCPENSVQVKTDNSVQKVQFSCSLLTDRSVDIITRPFNLEEANTCVSDLPKKEELRKVLWPQGENPYPKQVICVAPGEKVNEERDQVESDSIQQTSPANSSHRNDNSNSIEDDRCQSESYQRQRTLNKDGQRVHVASSSTPKNKDTDVSDCISADGNLAENLYRSKVSFEKKSNDFLKESKDCNTVSDQSSELGACGGGGEHNGVLESFKEPHYSTETHDSSSDINVSQETGTIGPNTLHKSNEPEPNEIPETIPITIPEANPETLSETIPTPAVDDSDIQRFEPMMAIIDKIAVGERVPPQITMRYEMLRFCTLRSFPKENKPFITRIAQAGFYYANTRDEVVCYCCAKRKSDWQETDVPLEVHRQLNPNCRFLNHNSEVNVSVKKQEQLAQRRSLSAPGLSSSASNPLIAATAAAQTSEANRQRNIGQSNQFSASTIEHTSTALLRTQTSTTLSQPTTTLSAPQGISRSRPLITVDRPHGNFSAQSLASSMSTIHSQSVCINSMASTMTTTTTTTMVSSNTSQAATVRPPKYPAYATQAQRDASFRDCSELVVPASSLAEAGFFYAGFGDCCRCFQCGVGLRHWSAEDDPWIEHSRWSKNCAFVREKKGEEFVNLVQMAIEYQQNQQNQQQQQQQSTTETGAEAGSGNDIEHLLHTDAAQSVLEMGYSTAVIQRAIRECINTNGNTEITAAMLMEKIFAFEESTAARAPPETPNTRMPETSTTVPNTDVESSNLQRNGEKDKRDNPRNAASNEEAVASNAALQHSNIGNQTSRKSQIREQKKLKEENERLKQQSICTQCKQNGVSIVFLPCGHLVTCEQCAEKVRYCTERNCGKYIKGTVRTYVA